MFSFGRALNNEEINNKEQLTRGEKRIIKENDLESL